VKFTPFASKSRIGIPVKAHSQAQFGKNLDGISIAKKIYKSVDTYNGEPKM